MERTKRNFVEIEAENSVENNLVSTGLKRGRSRQCAFTMNELLIVLAVVGIVGLLMTTAVNNRGRSHGTRIRCVNNLKNVGLAFRIFAADNDDNYPMQVSTNEGGVKELIGSRADMFRIYQSLSNELSIAKLLHCPADTRIVAGGFPWLQNTNISYFVGLDAQEAQPQMMLAGDRNIRANISTDEHGILTLRTNNFIGWTRDLHYSAKQTEYLFFGAVSYQRSVNNPQGNVVLSDGSVQQVNETRLRDQLRFAGVETNRFALPE